MSLSSYFRLQDLTSVDDSENQRIEEAIDIGAFKTLVVQVRKPVAATAPATVATLRLKHAAVLDEDAFVNVTGTTFDLMTVGTVVANYTDLLRYLKWSVEVTTGPAATPAQFLIDVVARES